MEYYAGEYGGIQIKGLCNKGLAAVDQLLHSQIDSPSLPWPVVTPWPHYYSWMLRKMCYAGMRSRFWLKRILVPFKIDTEKFEPTLR